QHRDEQRVRENEERVRLLATSIQQLVFVTRPDGDRTSGSPQWIALNGLGLDESLGFGWLDAIHPEDREATQDAWAEARISGEYRSEERRGGKGEEACLWRQTNTRTIKKPGTCTAAKH